MTITARQGSGHSDDFLSRHDAVMTFASLLVGSYAGNSIAQITPPQCPSSPACTKVITFYNNSTTRIYPVIQAGIQNPDPWLQAVFDDNKNSYAETHLSRVYINPVSGIPPGDSVSVTVPWWSQLENNADKYIDWWNGGRIYVFDDAAALTQVYMGETSRLSPSLTAGGISCTACEQPLTIYSDTGAYLPTVPFQLLEYTFADVSSPANAVPFIIDLHVGYNISYLDQV